MEPKDWISMAGIASTLLIAVMTLLINYRRELRQEMQRKEEREREHQLKIKEKEFELRYGKLQEKRVQAMSELYERLVSVSEKNDSLPFFLEPVEESARWKSTVEEAHKEYKDCALSFAKNRLYFSKELANRISSILSDLGGFSRDVGAYLDFNELDKLKNALAKWKDKRTTVVDTLEQIEDEFRGMLGSAN